MLKTVAAIIALIQDKRQHIYVSDRVICSRSTVHRVYNGFIETGSNSKCLEGVPIKTIALL